MKVDFWRSNQLAAWLCAVVTALCATPVAAFGQAPVRIPPDEAMQHAISHPQPPRPPLASLVGNPPDSVAADLVIDEAGRVVSIQVSSTSELVAGPVREALVAWTFTPFVRNGSPARVITQVELRFTGPQPAEDQKLMQAVLAGTTECRRQIERAPAESGTACNAMLEQADKLPPYAMNDRALAWYVNALSLAWRRDFPNALAYARRAVDVRSKTSPDRDIDTAEYFRLVGRIQLEIPDVSGADESFAAAAKTAEAAVATLPRFRAANLPRLQTILREWAQTRRRMNDEATATALEARAAGLLAPPTEAEARTLGGLSVIGGAAAMLTETDVSEIRALLPATMKAPWFILAQSGPSGLSVSVFLQPDEVTAAVRRGSSVVVAARMSPTGREPWRLVSTPEYAQVPIEGRDPNQVTGEGDVNRPFQITSFGTPARLSSDTVSELVRFLRRSASQAGGGAPGAAATGRRFNDVQPWAITNLRLTDASHITVTLQAPSRVVIQGQEVVVERAGSEFKLVELRPLGN